MKWKEAKDIGRECGMSTDAECIANIEMHAMNLFEYSKLSAELKELKDDCIANGIDYDTIMAEYDRQFNERIAQAHSEQEQIDHDQMYEDGYIDPADIDNDLGDK